MLSKIQALLATALFATTIYVLMPSTPAAAVDVADCAHTDYEGNCTFRVEDDGSIDGEPVPGKGKPSPCRWKGLPVPCSTSDGWYDATSECYLRLDPDAPVLGEDLSKSDPAVKKYRCWGSSASSPGNQSPWELCLRSSGGWARRRPRLIRGWLLVRLSGGCRCGRSRSGWFHDPAGRGTSMCRCGCGLRIPVRRPPGRRR